MIDAIIEAVATFIGVYLGVWFATRKRKEPTGDVSNADVR